MANEFYLKGQQVPVVAFYSIQGGVGKSTLARKFAELVTRATSPAGQNPNVLLIDLDVETSGLSFRITGSTTRGGTIHEAIAARNANVATARDVSAHVDIAAANMPRKGHLYLVPAAPQGAKQLADVIRTTEPEQVLETLRHVIDRLVQLHEISCVVIDCPPGSMTYSAAAAMLADAPVLVGRNEQATYDQIDVLPLRFRELYSTFETARQNVVINAVLGKDRFEKYQRKHHIVDWIPLTSDVIHESEGIENKNAQRMLLFENYIIALINRFLLGQDHLIPKPHDVLPQEYATMLERMERIDEAPRSRWFRFLHRVCLPVAVAVALLGLAAAILSNAQFLGNLQSMTRIAGIAMLVFGAALLIAGLFGFRERARLRRTAADLKAGGATRVFELLKGRASDRKTLEELLRISETIPLVPLTIRVRTRGNRLRRGEEVSA